MNQRILVWDLPTRLFHWLLAASFAGAYVTSESERWQNVHIFCGYTLLGLIAFRLVWGFVGSRYARFAEFVRGPGAVLDYLRSLWSGRPRHFTGHNPAGAVAVVLLLALGLATGATGWLTYQDIGGDILEELHEGLANAMLALVAIHIAGVIVSSWLHRENLVGAMVTGRKQGEAADGIARGQGILAVLMALAVTAFGWTFLKDAGNAPAKAKEHHEKKHHDHDHD